jgi:hypothetical protein
VRRVLLGLGSERTRPLRPEGGAGHGRRP